HPAVDILKKVGWWASEMIPQVAIRRHQEKVAAAAQAAHRQAIMNVATLKTAVEMAKQGDTGVMQSKEIQKIAEAHLGPMAPVWDTAIGARAARAYAHKNAFTALGVRNIQSGMDPTDAFNKTIQDATRAGVEVPTEAQSLWSQSVMAPEIARRKALAEQ